MISNNIIKSQSKYENVKLFYMTGIPSSEIENKIQNTGAEGYFLKPFDLTDLNCLFDILKPLRIIVGGSTIVHEGFRRKRLANGNVAGYSRYLAGDVLSRRDPLFLRHPNPSVFNMVSVFPVVIISAGVFQMMGGIV